MPFANSPIGKFYQNRLWLIVSIIQIILFAGTFISFRPFFETNDDVSMMLMAAGKVIVNSSTEHIAITGCLPLGWLLKHLYHIVPDLPWYGMTYFFLINLGMAVILYTLLRSCQKWEQIWIGLLLYAIWYILFGMENVVNVQFTRLAGMAGLAGWLLMHSAWGIHNQQSRILAICIAISLILVASSIRISSMILSLLILTVVLELPILRPYSVVAYLKSKFPVTLIVLLLALLADYGYQYQLERWNPNYLKEYNLRTIVDYQSIEVTDNKQELLEFLTWSNTDYDLVNSFFFLHKEATNGNVEKVFDVIKFSESYNKDALSINNFMHSGYDARIALIAIFIILIRIVFNMKNGKMIVCLILGFLTLKVMLLTIAVLMKPPPNRILGFAYAALPLGFIYHTFDLILRNPIRFSRQQLYITTLVVCLAIGICAPYLLSLRHTCKVRISDNQLLAKMGAFSNDKNRLCISWGNGFPYQWISPTQDVSKFTPYVISSTNLYPNALDVFKQFRIDDVSKAIMKGQVPVYIRHYSDEYVQQRVQLMKNYFKEKYNQSNVNHTIISPNDYCVIAQFSTTD